VINTIVDGVGNFVVKTKDPFLNDWSEPILLPEVGGIDPSLFFDEDGKAYIVHNDAPPGEPQWNGHRAIWIHDYDPATDATFGEAQVIIDGGVDKSTHPVWIEAPHLYKINGSYYLMAAEGGTSMEHSEVIFRSDKPKGPYVPYKNNPILTQRDLPAERTDPVTCAGHADLLQTAEGDWYAVFLACRPYEDNHFNTGRETFMLPVRWENGFPIILPKQTAIPYVVEKAGLSPKAEAEKGNVAWRDDFSSTTLADRWLFIRTPRANWWELNGQGLRLHSNGHSIYEWQNPAFIGARQCHQVFEVQTEVVYRPTAPGDIAGLVCFQDEAHNFVFGKTVNAGGVERIALYRSQRRSTECIAEAVVSDEDSAKPLTLKISGNKGLYSFSASYDQGETWTDIAAGADAKNLSTQTAGGFTGVVIGMYIYEQHQTE
jgi:alpha-N-arabinofuranosidase